MKNQELRSSLYKSGIILVVLVFLIYAFAAPDSGGITGTIASLFSGILFLVGLIFAVAVSIVVMFGIYFGILYMYDKDTCSKTYDEFKTKVADLSKSCGCSCHSICTPSKKVAPPISDEDLNPLRSTQDKLTRQLATLQNSVASLEKTLSTVSSSITGTTEEIAKLDERAKSVEETLESKATTDSVDDTVKKLAGDITTLQGSVKPLADKISELESSLSSLGSEEDDTDNELQETVNNAVSGIKDELAAMKKAIESLSNQPSEKEEAQDEEDTRHRILSYFSKKSDEKKFVALVAEAVGKEMTYAQVGEFLNDSLSAEACEVIDDHPSLTKDYIRICRQND